MDIAYERNVATLLTTIISNLVTIVLLGINEQWKKEKSGYNIGTPSWSVYGHGLAMLLICPIGIVSDAGRALRDLIRGMCLGFPYKYIRLLSSATYYTGYGLSGGNVRYDSGKEYIITIGNDQTNNDKLNKRLLAAEDYKYSTEVESIIWIPQYWPEKIMEWQDLNLQTLPNENYISDPDLDKIFSIKSHMGCLFGVLQCTSTILISCMRLQNVESVHTMDVLSMYTSYMLLCTVINVSFRPAYHVKPIVCIPKNEVITYQNINRTLLFLKLRLCVYRVFRHRSSRILLGVLLSIPIFLIASLLIYINRNNTLLLILSTVSVFVVVLGCLGWVLWEYLENRLYHLDRKVPAIVFLLIVFLPMLAPLGLSITLVVYSCLNATTEQKYPSSANWLPHL
jgi:hypothetical protein